MEDNSAELKVGQTAQAEDSWTGLHVLTWTYGRPLKMLNLDGLEVIAVLLVMGLFIKVLEQFGMFEPVGGEGNACLFLSEFCLLKIII